MPKKSEKNTTYKDPGGRPATGLKMHGTKKKFVREYPGQDPKIVVEPKEKPDFEATAEDPKDEASKHQYPPPKKHPVFRKIWMEFIENIASRDNFKVGHLNALTILCDLYVEYDDLQKFLRKKGRSYKTYGRQGLIWKFFPEVGQVRIVQAQIKEYMKMMGLLLKKDHGSASGGEKDNWD